MNRAKRIWQMLDEKELIVVMGVYDAVSARIAEHFGFPVIYMTGYATAAAYGYPDFGLLTMTEMLENLRRICAVVDIPLIADADTGYGNPLNVYRTVQEYEKAGAAGIQLEDQTWPKRCGHMEGKMVIDVEDMLSKIKAAVDARRSQETLLIMRTDAIATHGFDEAIHRAKRYAEAGADVIFVEAPAADQISKIPLLIPKACLLNVPFPNQNLDLKSLQEMGYSFALFPIITLLGSIEGCQRRCKEFMERGKYEDSKEMPFNFEKLNKFFGLDKYKELEKKYVLPIEEDK